MALRRNYQKMEEWIMLENIRLAFQGIWSHKMRSFLTMLGIIIGIASIISIVSTIKGTNEQIKNNLVGSGNNTVEVKLQESNMDYEMEYNGIPEGVPVLTEQNRERILDIDNVENVSFYLQRTTYDAVFYQDTVLSGGTVLGIDTYYFDTMGYQVKQGRRLVARDYEEYRKVVVIDTETVDNIFSDENPLGKTLEIKGEPFTVVGVMEKKTSSQPVINSIEDYNNYMGTQTGTVFIPDSLWSMIYGYDEPQNVVVRANDTETMSQVGRDTEKLLNEGIVDGKDSVNYKAADILETARRLQDLSATTNNQLIWIASISLLVGGIGVMNIMLVSVTERTSEIGLKKAIGARKSRILIQFLTEASVLTSLGGILGIIVGIIMAEVISRLTSTPVAISGPAILIALLFSMLIGIVFGSWPSVRAANLNPIDALRHE